MSPGQLAVQAFNRYADECGRLAVIAGTQLDLFEHHFAAVREWRGIWQACEAEAARAGR